MRGGGFQEVKVSMSFEICFWLERGGRFQEIKFSMLLRTCFWLERGLGRQVLPGLLEARFCDEFVKEFAIWDARGCQGLLEARFCNEFLNEFVI